MAAMDWGLKARIHVGVSINGGTPLSHPFLWDVPLQTIHFEVPALTETSIWLVRGIAHEN